MELQYDEVKVPIICANSTYNFHLFAEKADAYML